MRLSPSQRASCVQLTTVRTPGKIASVEEWNSAHPLKAGSKTIYPPPATTRWGLGFVASPAATLGDVRLLVWQE